MLCQKQLTKNGSDLTPSEPFLIPSYLSILFLAYPLTLLLIGGQIYDLLPNVGKRLAISLRASIFKPNEFLEIATRKRSRKKGGLLSQNPGKIWFYYFFSIFMLLIGGVILVSTISTFIS